ncbi:hypothetical protein [Streptomyces sp. GbtcB6]|uniref:hypothetical protein n=1 Tax=Streptomyces sp. GbtcB6 TaxID=2824751 RepID=UPI001C2FCD0B|nr:hypothetical protein [Streptomyces sp. GbtcB6]
MSGPLKKYRVRRGDVETVMKLSAADAERLGVGVDDLVDGASTIGPVEPVADGGADDGNEPDGAQETAADGAQAKPPAKKAAAKRQPAAANKAADGGS